MAKKLIPPDAYAPVRDLVFEATLKNTIKSLSPSYPSCGFRPFPLRHRCQVVDSGPRAGETFLLNTRLQRHDRENSVSVGSYFTDSGLSLLSMNDLSTMPDAQEVPLAESSKLGMSVQNALARRRTQRVFTGDSIPGGHLAAVIRAAQGITAVHDVPLYVREGTLPVALRAAPSPGGLYGISLFVAVRHVVKMAPGLYLYHAREDRLLLLKEDSTSAVLARIRRAYADSEELITHNRSNALFFLVGSPAKVTLKYGDRGIRYLFIEAGEITENIHLAATALGLGTVESVGFYDDELNEVLDLDGGSQTVIHSVLMGVPGTI